MKVPSKRWWSKRIQQENQGSSEGGCLGAGRGTALRISCASPFSLRSQLPRRGLQARPGQQGHRQELFTGGLAHRAVGATGTAWPMGMGNQGVW